MVGIGGADVFGRECYAVRPSIRPDIGENGIQVTEQYRAAVRNILQLLAERRADEAVAACHVLLQANPSSIDPLLLAGKAKQQQGLFDEMLQLVEAALQRAPQVPSVQLQYAGACQFCGHHDRALAELAKLETAAASDAALLQYVAELYVHAGRHADAHRSYARAVELESDNPGYLFNLATSLIAVGELDDAEAMFSKVIELDPTNFDAWYNRSTLSRQTRDDNHIDALETALRKLPDDDAGEAPLCYALAREYEDLGEDELSFSHLKRGADSRRRRLQYDVSNDVTVMQRIAELFTAEWATARQGTAKTPRPLFVTGMPRSGTTLVDRILSSHSGVVSLGEINDFAMTVTRLGRTTAKQRSLEVSVDISPDELGAEYVRSVTTYGFEAGIFIDKTPTNFFYAGLIARSLPNAAIVHVRRHPVDTCLAMYRTLFKTGYPFSYHLNDLAEAYIAYHALMAHWRSALPDRIHDVSYEALVDDQEAVSRELVTACGLTWEAQCLTFEKNAAPVSTASAAQVRRPVYRDALARWRRFESQLEPLVDKLDAAGIPL